MTREDRLLARILAGIHGRTGVSGFPGPGDDAAGVRLADGALALLTTDAAEEGVHFDRRRHPLPSAGRRAVAAAVSDIAAMGGAPVALLLSQVVPTGDEEQARQLAVAAARRAAELGAPVVGGNLTTGARLAVHVTVLGAMAAGCAPLTRSGGRAGDGLWVSGELGGSALGLALLAETRPLDPSERRLVERHLDPEPRLGLGQRLAQSQAASAAMDLSDGLALDLHRLARASGVGAVVEADRLPCAGTLDAALHGGEDYELLIAAPDPAAVEAAGQAAGVPLTRIGRVTEPGEGVRLSDGAPLEPRGWDALSPREAPRRPPRSG